MDSRTNRLLQRDDTQFGGRPDEASNLKPIGWLKSLETGNVKIDSEHRALVAQCDALSRFVTDLPPQGFGIAVAELKSAMASHFVSEAKVLLSTGFERVHARRREHKKILAQMEELLVKAERAKNMAEHTEIVRAIRNLLIETMIRHDLDFKSHLEFVAEYPLVAARGRRRNQA